MNLLVLIGFLAPSSSVPDLRNSQHAVKQMVWALFKKAFQNFRTSIEPKCTFNYFSHFEKWKEKQSQVFHHCFTPQITTLSEAGSGGIQEPGIQFESPTWVAGARVLVCYVMSLKHAFIRSWIEAQSQDFKSSTCDMRCGYPKQCPKCCIKPSHLKCSVMFSSRKYRRQFLRKHFGNIY